MNNCLDVSTPKAKERYNRILFWIKSETNLRDMEIELLHAKLLQLCIELETQKEITERWRERVIKQKL
jgi:hypothetical protein